MTKKAVLAGAAIAGLMSGSSNAESRVVPLKAGPWNQKQSGAIRYGEKQLGLLDKGPAHVDLCLTGLE